MKLSNFIFNRSGLVAVIAVSISLAGCASRPSARVLEAVNTQHPTEHTVTILAATDRGREPGKPGYDSKWAGGKINYERYAMSVPPKRAVASIEYPTVPANFQKQFVVTNRRQLSEPAFVSAATESPRFDGTVILFVHGYNYSYQEALFRTAQMAADGKVETAPILFSWPSMASITGYVADRDSVLTARTDLVSVISALAKSRKVHRVLLLGHSMGGFLVMESVRQLKLEHKQDVLNKLDIVLASPDIDRAVFISQLDDIGRLRTPITVLVSKDDKALAVSSFLGGDRPRVGRGNIDDPAAQKAAIQYHLKFIDISKLKATDGVGHDRYAAMAQFASEMDSFEKQRKASVSGVGTFIFDAAGAAAGSPFRLASKIISPH